MKTKDRNKGQWNRPTGPVKASVAGHEYVMDIPFSPERIFPLLCPVREYDWIEIWQCRLLHSESGLAELGCVFRTRLPGEGERVWICTRYEPDQEITYTVFQAGDLLRTLNIRLEPSGSGTRVTWTNRTMAISEAGEKMLLDLGNDQHQAKMRGLEDRLAHYLETGRMLGQDGS